MESKPSRTIYSVLGEPSGDILASAIFDEMNADDERASVQFIGLAGERLSARGVNSLFDIADLSVMGIGPVLAKLPKLLKRIRETVDDIVYRKPDLVLLVDSPEFCSQVARRVRKRLPDVPIVKYVCPSVWAWRPGRAAKMATYVDHVLCLLPFEPEALEALGGPVGTYVGHPATAEFAAFKDSTTSDDSTAETQKTVLLLPGSRSAEIRKSLPVFLKVAERLAMSNNVRFMLPTLDNRLKLVRELLADTRLAVEVATGDAFKLDAFRKGDCAIATSGTVSLELGLARVPHVVFYKLGFFEKMAAPLVTSWSVNLVNLIVDRVVVPELIGSYAKYERLLREVEALLAVPANNALQRAGFDDLWTRSETENTAAARAASVLWDHLK
jgi:lipid-A-disaccharide synthase